MTYEMAMLLNWLLVAAGLLASDAFSGLFEGNSDDDPDPVIVEDPISTSTFLGAGDDDFVGDDSDNNILGLAGNDTISGEAGADIIEGNTGDDFIYGGLGNDVLAGGDDNDMIFGGDGDDVLSSDRFDDRADFPRGESDVLDGGAGDDRLFFSDGDVVTGGSGSDTFGMIFSDEGAAQITDFVPGEDNIVLYVDDLNGAATTPVISYDTDTTAGNTTVLLDGTPTLVFDRLFTADELGVTLSDSDAIDFSATP